MIILYKYAEGFETTHIVNVKKKFLIFKAKNSFEMEVEHCGFDYVLSNTLFSPRTTQRFF